MSGRAHETRWRMPALLFAVILVPFAWAETWPQEDWERAEPEEMGMDRAQLEQARDYALTGGGAGYITRGGKLVLSWGDPKQRFDLKSTTKSFGATALGLAVADGKVRLTDLAAQHHPAFGVPPESNRDTGWCGQVTLGQLATQTAGFDKNGGYTPFLFQPGTKWSYSDGGPNWLAECLTLAYGRDLNDLMFERVFDLLGITPRNLVWRKNQYRPEFIEGVPRREFGSGISADVDAMARLGYLFLREGRWRDRQLLPKAFVAEVRTVPEAVRGLPVVRGELYPQASNHYGLLWWNNADGELGDVPRDAFWSWGLHDSIILVIPSLDIVVARAGGGWAGSPGAHSEKLAPFFRPIAQSVRPASAKSSAPYPQSPVITGVSWAPPESIVRTAEGSDNWPLTWADDGRMYTAYGDGWGFEPRASRKLSLGFGAVEGLPGEVVCSNIPSPTGEQLGDGGTGKKASGMLMVDGVLYLLARNAENSQLAWSVDRAKTWTWAGWRFSTSFGCPSFLNFGPDYAGARDEFVYVYSPDGESAYEAADTVVLARVPKDRIREQDAYKFYVRTDTENRPVWSRDIAARGPVFRNPGCCRRTTAVYSAALRRYMICQTQPDPDNRNSGGLGIFDAPEPWGPWTTVYYTEEWDAGPGETASTPVKWIAQDGSSLHLTFSGDDSFSIRQAHLTLGSKPRSR